MCVVGQLLKWTDQKLPRQIMKRHIIQNLTFDDLPDLLGLIDFVRVVKVQASNLSITLLVNKKPITNARQRRN